MTSGASLIVRSSSIGSATIRMPETGRRGRSACNWSPAAAIPRMSATRSCKLLTESWHDTRPLVLHQVTAMDVGPLELIDIAAASGCEQVSVFTYAPQAVLPGKRRDSNSL